MRWQPSSEQTAIAIDCAVARVPLERVTALLGVAESTLHAREPLRNDLAAENSAQNADLSALSTRSLLSQSDQNDWRTPRKYLEAARAQKAISGGLTGVSDQTVGRDLAATNVAKSAPNVTAKTIGEGAKP